MEIRAARAGDVPQVVSMVKRLAQLHESWDPRRYGYRPDVGEMYDSWLRQRATDAQSVFLVADAGGRIAGFLAATVESNIPVYTVARFGFIHDVWVEEDYRHEGLARQMTMIAIEKFTAMGLSQIRLETARINDPARSLFQSCGFRVSSIDMLYDSQEERGEVE